MSDQKTRLIEALRTTVGDFEGSLRAYQGIFEAERAQRDEILRAPDNEDRRQALRAKDEQIAALKNSFNDSRNPDVIRIREICAVKDFGDSKAPAKIDACAKIITECIKGEDSRCLGEFAELAKQVGRNGIDDIADFKPDVIQNLLDRIGLFMPPSDIISTGRTPIDEWLAKLRRDANGDKSALDAINKIESNNALCNLLNHLFLKVYRADLKFGTVDYDIAFASISKLKLLPRYKKSSVDPQTLLRQRGTRLPVTSITQYGGGNSINNRHVRFFDALERQFMMTGGGQSYPLISPALEKTLAEIMKDLESNGKTVERGDLEKIQEIMKNFNRTEKKVQDVVGFIQKLQELLESRTLREPDRSLLLENLNAALEREKRELVAWKDQGRTVINIFKHIRDEAPIDNESLWRSARIAKTKARLDDIKNLFDYKNEDHPSYHFVGESGSANTSPFGAGERSEGVSLRSPTSEGGGGSSSSLRASQILSPPSATSSQVPGEQWSSFRRGLSSARFSLPAAAAALPVLAPSPQPANVGGGGGGGGGSNNKYFSWLF